MLRSSTTASSHRGRWRLAVIGLAVGGLVLAACGGDNSGGSSSATTAAAAATTAAGAATTAGGAATTAGGAATTAGGSAAAPTGTPIKVMTVAPVNTNLPPYPNIPEAAKVYAQYINDKGGIAGHPLEVITCDDKGDANEAANCARQAVDQKVTAVVGSFIFDASRLIGILQDANVAWFGACCPIVEQEFSSPISYVLGANFSASTAAVVKMMEDGCKKPASMLVDVASKDLAKSFIDKAYQSKGFDPANAKFVTLPLAAQDYSAQVAEATDGTDCIYGGIADSNWAAFLPAFKSAGATQRLYGLQGNLNGKIAEAFPKETEGGIVVNSYPNIAGPMWDDYRAALEKYKAPDLDWNSLAGLGTWAAYTAFTQIAEKMTSFGPKDFIDAANKSTAVDTGGMIPVIDLSKPWTGLDAAYPRIFNRSNSYDVIHDGKLTALEDNKFHDQTAAMEGKPS